MVAYNYFIDFVPPLEAYNNVENLDKITIEKSEIHHFSELLNYQKSYSNNQGREIILSSSKPFSRTQKNQIWSYEIKEVMTFFWRSGEERLCYYPEAKFTLALLKYWTLHIVLPLFFTIEERYHFLHAGGVEIEGSVVLFIGNSFGGKSTLVHHCIKKGDKMLSDDKVASILKKDSLVVLPSYSYHRPYRKLEDLGYFTNQILKGQKRVTMMYHLEKSSQESDILIKEVEGIEKFKLLRYAVEFNLSFLKVRNLVFLGKVLKHIVIYKIKIPWSLQRLDEVYDALSCHIREVGYRKID